MSSVHYAFGFLVSCLITTDLLFSFLPFYSCGVSQINGNFNKLCTGLLGNNIMIEISDKEKLISSLHNINDNATSKPVIENKVIPLEEHTLTYFSILLYVCLFVINYLDWLKENHYEYNIWQYGKFLITTCIFYVTLMKHLVGIFRKDLYYGIKNEVYYGETFYGYTVHLCNIFIVMLIETNDFMKVLSFSQTNQPDRAIQTELYYIC
ncbi:uncharacterized protein LOC136087183 [Hydra vulgaris]|uniref:Uncharacterized protein LOC136087183 n=1 Tax=Hydra vulgaris TaxID=6087 RepID=A0ABM4CUW9_HYDVU